MRSLHFVFWLSIILVLPGCGGTSAEPVRNDVIDPPASWTADGKTWSHQPSMSQADEAALTKFFQLHPSFQGSSEFEGSPALMLAGQSDRRFYWIRGSADSSKWNCVHFEGGKFRTSEGTGNPFLK